MEINELSVVPETFTPDSSHSWDQRMSFEALITAVATQLINLNPEEIDSGINHALSQISEYTHADRSYVLLYTNNSLCASHVFCQDPHYQQIRFTDDLYNNNLTWLTEKLNQSETIHISNVAALPPEARQEQTLFTKLGVLSLLAVPMIYQNTLIGILGIDTFQQTHVWRPKDISILKITGEMITNVLKRKEIEKHEKLAYELGGQLASLLDIDDLIYHTINQLRNTFGYYHAQVYLVENIFNSGQKVSQPKQLILYAGTGDIGARLRNRGHAIPLAAPRSIVARAARTHETIIVDDVRQVDYHLPNPALPHTRSEVAFPLISEQELIGCLDVQHTNPYHFDDNAIRTLQIITHQLSTALAKAGLFLRNQKLVEEMSLLQKVAVSATEAATQDELLSRITEVLQQALPHADSIGFCLLEAGTNMLRDHAAYHYRDKSAALTVSAAGEGIAGHVINTGKLWNVADVSLEPAYIGDPLICSQLCVPIKVQDHVIGIINAESTRLSAFSDREEHLLTTITGYISTAIEKIALFESTQAQAAETAALRATSKAISSLELGHVLNTIAQEAKNLFKVNSSRIHLIEPDGKTMRCVVVASDRPEVGIHNFISSIRQGITGSVAISGLPEIIPNTLADRRMLQIPGTSVVPEAMALAPLTIRQQVIGVMVMTRRGTERPFLESDLNLLTAMADQAAVAIDNARLFAAERRQLEELTVLNKMATAAAKEIQEEALLNKAVALAQKITQTAHTSILILDKSKNTLVGYGLHPDAPQELPINELPVNQSIIARVMLDGETQNIPNVHEAPAYSQIRDNIQSALCVPINISGQAVGVINIESETLAAFSPADERFLATFARQIAVGLEKVHLLAAEQSRTAKQQKLVEMGIALLGTRNLAELWPAVTAVAQEILNADRIAFYQYHPDTDTVTCPFAHNLSSDYIDALNERFRQVPGATLLQSPQPILVEDAQTHPAMQALRKQIQNEGFRSYGVFQLPGTDIPLGALVFYRDKIAPFDSIDQAIGQTLAYIVSVAYQNVQLLTEIHHTLLREQQLNNITRELNTTPNLPGILAAIIRSATELVSADAGLVGLVIDEQIMTYYPYNIPISVNLRPTLKGSGIAWQIVETRESILTDQYQDHEKAQHKFIKVGVRAFIGVPIVAGDQCLGVLKLFSLTPGKKFSDRDKELVESIGRQAGIVIQNRRLYHELTERAQALTTALARQEELDQAKNSFIHNVSHELRTPIGLIYGYSELLHTGGLGPLTNEQQNSISIIVKRVKMLISLLDDLSVLLAAETQEFRREEIQPASLLESVTDEFQLQAQKAQITLRSEIEENLPLIYGDPFHLRRVFDNLLSNAFKFTSAQGVITIRSWREGHEVLIEVSDTGSGISTQEMERIFERFYQAKASSSGHHKGKGTGLGLALVKEIVEAHRGKVTVRSRENEGTTFKIRLPGIDL
jgi:GAF domain-containing protein